MADGKSLLRMARLLARKSLDFYLIAGSGTEKQNAYGLIVPCFEENTEKYVSISRVWGDVLSKLLLLTKEALSGVVVG